MIETFSKAYKLLNQDLFQSKLPTVDFSISLSRKDIFQFSSPNVFEIGTGLITARPVDIIDDLLHNMVHVYNHIQDTQDVTQNQYHNLAFCDKALEVGLIVTCHKTRGWGVTHTDPDVEEEKIRHPEKKASSRRSLSYSKIELPVEGLAEFQSQLQERLGCKPIKQFQFKYICRCDPPFIVRVGTRPDGDRCLLAECKRCNTNFVLDESRPAP